MDYREKVLYLLNQQSENTDKNISLLSKEIDDLKSNVDDIKKQFTVLLSTSGIIDYVDLDLPSGTLWTTYNAGAVNNEDPGSYFQWGALVKNTKSKAKDASTWKTYPANDNNEEANVTSITKWDSNGNVIDNHLAEGADYIYQAAHNYVMPTKEQLEELIKYTDIEFPGLDIDNLKKGYRFHSKKDPSKYMVIPATDDTYFVDGAETATSMMHTALWSSTLNKDDITQSYCLRLFPSNTVGVTTEKRCAAMHLRGVLNQKRI